MAPQDVAADSHDAAQAALDDAEPSAAAQAATLPQAPSILQLAWPAVMGNLLMSSVNIANIKIVGKLGPQAVAAVTTGNRIHYVMQAVVMAASAGTTALVARAWGANDRVEAERWTRASVGVGAVLALIMSMPAILFAPQLVRVFRLDAAALASAADYVFYNSFFNVAFAVAVVLAAAVRAAGDTVTPLVLGGITNAVNVVLVYGLVHGRWGLPALGVKGAAIANGIAFSVGAGLAFALWWRGRLRVGRGPAGSLTRARIQQLLRVGYPAGLEQASMQMGLLIFLWVVSFYGTAPFAAYGIGVQILSLSFIVGFGFSVAAATHVGQRLGAGDADGAARSGWHAMWLSLGAMVLLGGLLMLFARETATFMIQDPEVVRLTVIFMYFLGTLQPLMAVEFALGGALRGAGDTRFPLKTSFIGLVLVRGGTAAVFAALGLSVEWVFGALVLDYVVKATMLVGRFHGGRWKTLQL